MSRYRVTTTVDEGLSATSGGIHCARGITDTAAAQKGRTGAHAAKGAAGAQRLRGHIPAIYESISTDESFIFQKTP